MNRRQVLAIMAAACAASTVRAQTPTMVRLGYLSAFDLLPQYKDFLSALRDLGYRIGENLTVETRLAQGDLALLPAMAAELVKANVNIIVTQTTPATEAAKGATTSIPIVMASSGDALGAGLIASLARPGGNVTGLSFLGTEVAVKQMELIHQVVPKVRRMALLAHGGFAPGLIFHREMAEMAPRLGVSVDFIDVRGAHDLEPAFARMVTADIGAVVVTPGIANFGAHDRIVGLAVTHKLPVIYGRRDFVDRGGLISYGTDFAALYRRAAVFVDRIVKGANPATLPVEQPTRFELIINMKAAATLGLNVPPLVMALADEVIE